MNLILHFTDLARGLEQPRYATMFSSGFDLRANLLEHEPIIICPGERELVPLGITSEILPGYEIQIRPRSGLALKYGITVLNSPGTIDADYRGEWGVILYNSSKQDFTINRADRIAQAVLCKVERANIMVVYDKKELSETERGKGGYGSSGIS